VSLLLEALKKAELAKQQSAGAQQGEPTVPAPEARGGPLSLEPLTGNSVEPPLITRDRLPDITQPLEILSEDLPSAGARREAAPRPAARAPEQPPLPVRPTPTLEGADRETRTNAAAEDSARAYARQLFEAKSVDYNPRRPFFIALGALVVVGVAAAGYFAYQVMAPRPSFYAGPAGGRATQPIATAPVVTPQPSPTTSAPAPSLAAAPDQATQQGTRTVVAAAPQPAPATGATAKSTVGQAAAPRPGAARAASAAPTPAAAAEPIAPATPARPPISVTPAAQRLDPALERGWEALQRGDLERAREEYLRALKANPLDRDALLGLATIDARNRDFGSAEARYIRVLEIDPRDPYAQAGMIALRGQIDPVQSESRLKNLLAQQPDVPFLNFALGNQYAVQSRWPEAQQAYFKAYTADPENADYVLNLAVSLDHMRQSKPALEYYQRALALIGQRPADFNKAQIEARISELQR